VVKRVAAVGIVILAVALALAGCSSGDTPSNGPGGQPAAGGSEAEPANRSYNGQDVAFASGMLRHNDQAIELAKLAATRATGSEVRTFARGMERSRTAEVRTLNGWLRSWDTTSPPATGEEAAEVSGLMAPEDVEALEVATGGEFDWMFLTMMMEQEQGAADMAEQQVRQGRFPDAVAMARAIQQRRVSEITKMQRLLGNS